MICCFTRPFFPVYSSGRSLITNTFTVICFFRYLLAVVRTPTASPCSHAPRLAEPDRAAECRRVISVNVLHLRTGCPLLAPLRTGTKTPPPPPWLAFLCVFPQGDAEREAFIAATPCATERCAPGRTRRPRRDDGILQSPPGSSIDVRRCS